MKNVYIGIDPSFNGFTACIITDDKLVDYTFINLSEVYGKTYQDIDIYERIEKINFYYRTFLSKITLIYNPETCEENTNVYIGMEFPYYNRLNPKVYTEQVRLFHDLMIINRIWFHKENCFEAEPRTIKKCFGAGGNADKLEMFESLKKKNKKYYNKEIFKSLENIKNIKLKKDIDKKIKEREGLVDAIAVAVFCKECVEKIKDTKSQGE